MSKNNKGVYIDSHTDKKGKDHISIYDKNPKEDNHSSIHINIDTNTGKGKIVDTTKEEKEVTDINCYLTTACMRYQEDLFNDNKARFSSPSNKMVNNNDTNIKQNYIKKPVISNKIKEIKGCKSRCIVEDGEKIDDKCVCCGKEAKHHVIWGIQY